MLDFIIDNYVSILLIIGIVLAIFISGSNKKTYGKSLILLSLICFLFIILDYIENLDLVLLNNNLHKTFVILLFIIQPIELFLYVLSFIEFNKRNFLISAIPCLINTIFVISFSFSDLILNFDESNALVRGPLFYFDLIICFIYLIFAILKGIISLFHKKISDGLILLLSCISNIFALLIGVDTMTFDIANSSILFSSVLVFLNSYIKEQAINSANQEKMIQEQKTSLTISQIQPHFLYNSLATIGYLCQKDPKTASVAIDQFSDYLRANLNSITKKENVPFLQELKHVKTYVALEKLRFENRLKVIYDIQYTDFLVPSLSLQPLVENAIKHGICNKIEGGTLTIRTIEYREFIKVVIEDDGVGFDSSLDLNDGRTHVGIENVRSRLKSMSNASLEIQSKVGKGTKATITFNKEQL